MSTMRLQTVISENAPDAIIDALGSKAFAIDFLTEVVGKTLGVDRPDARPAEYFVQKPSTAVAVGHLTGIELRLSGVSRNGRKARQFHDALKALERIASAVLQTALNACPKYERVQLFCVLMLDGEVETRPGSGVYSNVLETEAIWLNSRDEVAE